MSPPLVVERGRILAYRVVDVGDTIALDVAERLVQGSSRFKLGGTLVEGLVIPVRPLAIDLGELDIVVPSLGMRLPARASAHVFDFGALSILYDVPIVPGSSLQELIPLCDALYEASELDAEGKKHREELLKRLGSSVEKPHDWAEVETYTIVFVEKFADADGHDGRTSFDGLADSEVVAKLLLGETSEKPLNATVRRDVLGNAFSYLEDDLVIVDWNSALVVEPNGSRIVPFLLELATCQLLEFRYYDTLLDAQLARVYEHVEKSKPRVFRSPYRGLTRDVLRRFMELTEFSERVDNAIKSVGDVYLARVYLAAIKRFRVPDWRESVEAKLGLVARAFDLLKGEVDTSRAELLEIIVVLLILAELLAAFRPH
ncbi:hypothetical protein AKJ09_07943 [Labilithrix luteola]|uniref:DUF155 domain-containing protein n=1 Tax=Labilithrix luteola TaxID=1391654 RepID=A0A0K1Q7A9_9BACT|nr:hypothetical protein [Labilithrix luteola]AKV01280.1 hypothetical protein AKJ09_07943 [Labilithrix luteola]